MNFRSIFGWVVCASCAHIGYDMGSLASLLVGSWVGIMAGLFIGMEGLMTAAKEGAAEGAARRNADYEEDEFGSVIFNSHIINIKNPASYSA